MEVSPQGKTQSDDFFMQDQTRTILFKLYFKPPIHYNRLICSFDRDL